MSKEVPVTRRDSGQGLLHSGSSQDSPIRTPNSRPPQKLQPIMARPAKKSHADKTAMQYTLPHIQQMPSREAQQKSEAWKLLRQQITPDIFLHICQICRARIAANTAGRLPKMRTDVFDVALESGYITHQQVQAAVHSLALQAVAHTNSTVFSNGCSPKQQQFPQPGGTSQMFAHSHLQSASPYGGANGYQPNTGDMQTKAFASSSQSYSQQDYTPMHPFADVLRKKHASGAKVSTGAPVRTPPVLSQEKTPEIIDLTGPDVGKLIFTRLDARKRKAKSPHVESTSKRKKATTIAPSAAKDIPFAKDINYRARSHGLTMADVKYGSVESSMKGWQIHQQDVVATRSQLSPPPGHTQRLDQEPKGLQDTSNTIPTEYAQALGLPTNFDYREIQAKVRDPAYDFSFSGNNGGKLPWPFPVTTEQRANDSDSSLRAPEEKDISPEQANLQWELMRMENKTDSEWASWNDDAVGTAYRR